jgi:hypothetical protein
MCTALGHARAHTVVSCARTPQVMQLTWTGATQLVCCVAAHPAPVLAGALADGLLLLRANPVGAPACPPCACLHACLCARLPPAHAPSITRPLARGCAPASVLACPAAPRPHGGTPTHPPACC